MSGAHIAAAAAAAQQERERLLREEEELLTHYSDRDLADDWEFKIVRSGSAAFRKPEELARLVEQEARFGWVLLEKLDDARVRFKRRAGSGPRLAPSDRTEDPYRSIYGGKPIRPQVAALAIFLGTVVLFIGMALLFSR